MKHTFPKIGFSLLLAAVLFGCKKNSDGGVSDASFQSFTLKFGSDSTAITIDSASKVLKNMPRSCDVTKLAAAAVLPAGGSISPDPATVTDYTKGVTYTIKTSNGKTYTVQITAPVYDPVSNPYGIYTAKQLNDVRNGLNDSYVLMNDIELPALTTAGSASVGISDYRDYGWYSIGGFYINRDNSVVFRGTLDGQNHVIKNLSMAYRGSSKPDGIDVGKNFKGTDGLFGYAVHATFKNIGIQLAAAGINDNDPATDGYGPVGGLTGFADSSTITNCYVTGSASVTGKLYTGGLIGTVQNSTISKCYAVLTPATGYAIVSGNAGGLIANAFNCDISDSYAACSVYSSTDVGGLLGSANGCTVKTCYASGNVVEVPLNGSSSLVPSNTLGGLIGSVTATISGSFKIQNCYASGTVTGANGSNTDFHKSTRIGGLIGQIGSATGSISVTNCYASGAIFRVNISATAPFLTGGLVGATPNGIFIAGTCTNYWDRTTTGQTNLGGGNTNLAQDNAYTTNGKTTAEMKAAATYANWDFSAIWNVAGSTNSGYPYLRSTNK